MHKILKQSQIWLVVFILTLVSLIFDTSLNLSFDLPKILAFRILISVSVIVFVVNQFSRKLKTSLFHIYCIPFFNKMGLLSLLIILSLIMSQLLSVNKITSFWGSYDKRVGLFTYLHLFIWIPILIDTLKNYKDEFLNTLKFALPLTIFVNLSFSIYQLNWGTWDLPESRPVGTFGQANYLAGFVALTLPILFWFFQNTKSKWVKLIQAFAILSSISIILMTKSRIVTIILIVLLSLSTTYLVFVKIATKQKLVTLVLSLSLIVLSIIFIYPRFSEFGFIDNTRILIFENAFSLIFDRPFFGYGFDNQIYTLSSEVYKNSDLNSLTVDRSHNEFLDQILNLGMFGFVSFCILFLFVGYKALQNGKKHKFNINPVAFLGVIIFFARSVLGVNGIVHYTYLTFFFSILIYENFDLVKYEIKSKLVGILITSSLVIFSFGSIYININEYFADKSYKMYLQTQDSIYIKDAVSYNPYQSRYLSELIGYLLLEGRFEVIDDDLIARHLDVDYNYPQFYYISSVYYANMGRETESSQLYFKAKELDPNNPIFQE